MLSITMLRTLRPASYESGHPIPQMNCVAYTPFFHFFSFDQHYNEHQKIKAEWVERDLQFLSRYTSCIRIYTTTVGMEIVPAIAARYNMRVIAGAYFYEDEKRTKKDMEGLIKMANSHSNITHLIVGNETFYYNAHDKRDRIIDVDTLVHWLKYVRERTKQPVSTAEEWDTWLNPSETPQEVIDNVDYIAAHILLFWRGVSARDVPAAFVDRYRQLQSRFPGKEIIAAEVGWPTAGNPYMDSFPDKEAAHWLLTQVTQAAKANQIPYVIIEAFDQPWKINGPWGRTEVHWGIFDTNYHSKFDTRYFTIGSVVITYMEAAHLLLALMFFLLWSDFRSGIDKWTWVSSAALANFFGYFFVLVIATLIEEYVYKDILLCLILIPAFVILIATLIYKTRQILQVVGAAPLRRVFESTVGEPGLAPFVSVHVPCRNEQPEHVIACVESLLAQDYPAFEIVVIDNNTTDEALWRPLEAFCLQHRGRVKFFHVENMQGFKAGALRYTLEKTDPRATVIGLVDADYIVDRNWLKDCTRHFMGKVGAVQAPQDYMQEYNSLFMRSIYDEYVGFFRIGMVQRNESNAIIQHGTMLLVDREVLGKVGGWQTDTIVEDTDLGLRLLIGGYECAYVNRVYGRGRLPERFSEYRKQRFRWSYGAMRVIVKYWKELFGLRPGLTWVQRGHFLLGWVPWIGNVFHPLFVAGALVLSGFYLWDPGYAITAALFGPILLYVLLDAFYSWFLYAERMRLPFSRILWSTIAGASLVWTIGRGIFIAVFYSKYPFKVTKKGLSGVAKKGYGSSIPIGISLLCLFIGTLVLHKFEYAPPFDVSLWIVLMAVLAFPGICCILMLAAEKRPTRQDGR